MSEHFWIIAEWFRLSSEPCLNNSEIVWNSLNISEYFWIHGWNYLNIKIEHFWNLTEIGWNSPKFSRCSDTRHTFNKGRKHLRESKSNIFLNEDLTKLRKKLAYECRSLKMNNNSNVIQTWSLDGKIFVMDKQEKLIVYGQCLTLRSSGRLCKDLRPQWTSMLKIVIKNFR